jgi:hypothetical protein
MGAALAAGAFAVALVFALYARQQRRSREDDDE